MLIYEIELMVVRNVFALLMNIALPIAAYQVVKETGICTILHEHDCYWVRKKYLINCDPELLEKYYLPKLSSVQH